MEENLQRNEKAESGKKMNKFAASKELGHGNIWLVQDMNKRKLPSLACRADGTACRVMAQLSAQSPDAKTVCQLTSYRLHSCTTMFDCLSYSYGAMRDSSSVRRRSRKGLELLAQVIQRTKE